MRVYVDGGIDAQALWLKGRIGSRIALGKVIKRHAGPDCTGVFIDEPFSAQCSSVKALFRMLGAAVLACELAGIPCSKVHLSKLKILGTGKGILAMKGLSVHARGSPDDRLLAWTAWPVTLGGFGERE